MHHPFFSAFAYRKLLLLSFSLFLHLTCTCLSILYHLSYPHLTLAQKKKRPSSFVSFCSFPLSLFFPLSFFYCYCSFNIPVYNDLSHSRSLSLALSLLASQPANNRSHESSVLCVRVSLLIPPIVHHGPATLLCCCMLSTCTHAIYPWHCRSLRIQWSSAIVYAVAAIRFRKRLDTHFTPIRIHTWISLHVVLVCWHTYTHPRVF